MERNNNVYGLALRLAERAGFLVNREEFFWYAGALYSAMMWGREVDKKNRAIQRKGASVK